MIGPGRNTAPASVLAGEAVGADAVGVGASVDPPGICATCVDVLPSAKVHERKRDRGGERQQPDRGDGRPSQADHRYGLVRTVIPL